MKKQIRTGGIGFYVLILAIIFMAVYVSGAFRQGSDNSYNIYQFEKDLGNGTVQSVEVFPNEEVPTGEVKVVLNSKKTISFYVSDVNKIGDLIDGYKDIEKNYVVNDIQKPSWVITTLLPYG